MSTSIESILSLVPLTTPGPNASFWYGIKQSFWTTFSLSSPCFICAWILNQEGWRRGFFAYLSLAAASVFFQWMLISGHYTPLAYWSELEPFLYGASFFLLLTVYANCLNSSPSVRAGSGSGEGLGTGAGTGASIPIGIRKQGSESVFPFFVIFIGSLANPPLTLPFTRFIMRTELFEAADFSWAYLLGIGIGTVGLGLAGSWLAVRSARYGILAFTNIRRKSIREALRTWDRRPDWFLGRVWVSMEAEKREVPLPWDFTAEARNRSLDTTCRYMMYFGIALLIKGLLTYHHATFRTYPLEYVNNQKLWQRALYGGREKYIFGKQRRWRWKTTGVRKYRTPLKTRRKDQALKFVRVKRKERKDKGVELGYGKRTRRFGDKSLQLRPMEVRSIVLRHRAFPLSKLHKSLTRKRIAFRTPKQRRISIDQIKAMRLHIDQYGQPNETTTFIVQRKRKGRKGKNRYGPVNINASSPRVEDQPYPDRIAPYRTKRNRLKGQRWVGQPYVRKGFRDTNYSYLGAYEKEPIGSPGSLDSSSEGAPPLAASTPS